MNDMRSRRGYRTAMSAIRLLLRHHRAALILLLAMTALARLIVPAGFMPTATAAGMFILPCPGAGPVATMVMMDHGAGHHDYNQGHGDAGDKAGAPCAFAGLAAPGLGGADPIQLGIALAFILLVGLATRQQLPVRSVTRLRPPLRGPPVRG